MPWSRTRSSPRRSGDHVYSHYLEAKREEWAEYPMQITGGSWTLPRGLLAARPDSRGTRLLGL